MDKRFLSIMGMVGCLGFTLLALVVAILLAKYINALLAFIISGAIFFAAFLFFFNILYSRGVEIRTAAFYEDSINNFNDIITDDKLDVYTRDETADDSDRPKNSK